MSRLACQPAHAPPRLAIRVCSTSYRGRRPPDVRRVPEMTGKRFYRTTLDDIYATLSSATRGHAWEIGRSAGGRPLWAIGYGDKEPIAHAANLSSALAARRPEAFFGAERRQKQVLLIVSALHGGEMESIAAVL